MVKKCPFSPVLRSVLALIASAIRLRACLKQHKNDYFLPHAAILIQALNLPTKVRLFSVFLHRFLRLPWPSFWRIRPDGPFLLSPRHRFPRLNAILRSAPAPQNPIAQAWVAAVEPVCPATSRRKTGDFQL